MERKQASDYPQELLDIFHEYQHGEISRREFFDRANKFAVGGVTVAALFESLRPNYAFAQQVARDDARITTGYESVASPNGNGSIRGYFARPASIQGRIPAVLVIHENRGLNPYIEDVARRFALINFLAYAPDGTTSVGGYPGNDEAGAQAFRQVDGPKMFEDFVASFEWLKGHAQSSGRVGIVGFCFGGGISGQMAVRRPDLGGAVPFYGRQPNPADAAKIQAPLLIHFAETDQGVNRTWPPFEEALKAAGKTYAAHTYPGTQHGFHNDTTPRYNEEAAKLAWQRTVEFFNQHLR